LRIIKLHHSAVPRTRDPARVFCNNEMYVEGGSMSTQPKADPELVEVFDTVQESEAMVIHGLLSPAGVESLVTNLQFPQDIFPGVGSISVRVNPAQEEEARRIIEDYKANAAADDDQNAAEESAAGPA